MRRQLIMGAVAGLVAALAFAGVAQADDGGRPFTVTLTGAAEVPGPGDPDASGTASLRLNPGQGEICLDIEWADIDGMVTAGHIHAGEATVAGPVVVPLFAGGLDGTDSVSGCVAADRGLILDIIRDPDGYYVNVHSSVFPAGAIRGQLG
ncbi:MULTISPECIES: CHRD domain-containing protein [Microbacterium]|uniref:CHRD domain-containing protein n=1 Tax=Microbacterium TaxID=33882 RepID=UPI000D65C604|nr:MULTISPECIES: CHRD domain-containing protein [Microbacterium]